MPELTPQQLTRFYDNALSLGKTREEADEYLRLKGYSSPSGTARLGAQFAGTQAIPTEDVRRIEPVGAFEGLESLIPATLHETVVGPFVGIGERLGLAEEGSREDIRDKFEKTRIDYLASDPTATRATIAGLTEAAGNVIPLVPGGPLGKGAAKLAAKAGAKSLGTRAAAGASVGLAEGAVVGVGDTVGLEPGEALKRGALMTLAGGAFGSLGGVRQGIGEKNAADLIDPDTEKYLGRYIAGDPKRGGVADTARSLADRTRAHWMDEHAPVIDRPTGLLRAEGKKSATPEARALRAEQREALLLANQAKTSDHTALSPIETHTRDPITQEITGEGLFDVLTDGLPESALPDLKAAGLARRQLELAKRSLTDKSIKVNEVDTNLARAELARLDAKYGEGFLDKRLARFRDWSVRATIEPLRRVGVFSDKEVADMLESNQWYVPFFRAATAIEGKKLDIGLGGAPGKGKKIHRGLGDLEKELIQDPFSAAAERAVRVHSFARKQGLRNFMGDFAVRYADDIGDEVAPVTAQHIGHTFRHWRDGNLTDFKAPRELTASLETLNFKQANLLARTARASTQTFRAGATLTPEFSFRNFFKDAFTFSVNSRYHNFGPLSLAKNLFGELAHMAGHRGDTSVAWKEFMDSAAAHSTWLSADRSGQGVERGVKVARKIAESGKAKTAFDRGAKNPLAALQAIGQFIERLPRYVEFKGSRKAGQSIRQAEFDAGDVTLPFHRAGSIGKRANLYEAFFNAQMQDISKFHRALRERRFTTMFRGMAAMTVPTLATWYRHRDDPEYQSLPEWEKVLFMHTHKMKNGKYFRLPLPPGILGLTFSYLPRKMADHFYGQDPQALERLMEETIQQTPFQYVPVPGLNSMQDALTRLAPNAVQPLVEVMTNHNPFFDRPVMSERLLGRDPMEQKTKYTSNLAKSIASGASKIPGLSETRAASPGTIEYLLSGYGAGIARTVAQATGSEMPRRMVGKEGIFAIPGFRGLVSASPVGFSSQPVQDLYDLSERIEQSWSTFKVQSTEDHRRDYLSMHPEAAYDKEMRQVKEELKGYSKQRESIQNDPNLLSVEKQEALLILDQSITAFAAAMMTEFYKAIDRDKQIEHASKGTE